MAREDYPHAIDNLEMCLAQGGSAETTKPLLSKARAEQSKALLATNQRVGGAKLTEPAPQLDPNIPVPGSNGQRELRLKPPIPDPPANDKEVEALIKTGDELSNDKDYRGADKAYTEAVRKAPQQGELYDKRATNLLAQGFADRAQGDIETAIRLDGNTPERNRLRAWILLGVHDSYTSVEIANNLMRQNADDAEAYAIRGTAYLDRGLLDETIRDLNYAVELSPPLLDRVKSTLAEAYYRRSLLRKYTERWKESQADKARAEEFGWVIEPEPKPTDGQKQT